MPKKRNILKKTTHKKAKTERRELSLSSSLINSFKFMQKHKFTFLIWMFVNYLFLLVFTFIPNGWTNSLSILWLVLYYIYWCTFVRYVQQHEPYFSIIRIINGLIPASKIMFLNIALYIIFVVLPYIPLFMGFRDTYLELFEEYMLFTEMHNGLTGKLLFYLLILIISPYTITRPYLAWISSLVGKSRSVLDAYKKTKGNYTQFVNCAIVMSALFALSYYIDTEFNMNTLIYVMSVFMVFFNVVFIKLYKCFYKGRY